MFLPVNNLVPSITQRFYKQVDGLLTASVQGVQFELSASDIIGVKEEQPLLRFVK